MTEITRLLGALATQRSTVAANVGSPAYTEQWTLAVSFAENGVAYLSAPTEIPPHYPPPERPRNSWL